MRFLPNEYLIKQKTKHIIEEEPGLIKKMLHNLDPGPPLSSCTKDKDKDNPSSCTKDKQTWLLAKVKGKRQRQSQLKRQWKTKTKTKRKTNLAPGAALFQLNHRLFHLGRYAKYTCQCLQNKISADFTLIYTSNLACWFLGGKPFDVSWDKLNKMYEARRGF